MPASKWYVQGGRGGWRRMTIEQFPCVEQSLVGEVVGRALFSNLN